VATLRTPRATETATHKVQFEVQSQSQSAAIQIFQGDADAPKKKGATMQKHNNNSNNNKKYKRQAAPKYDARRSDVNVDASLTKRRH